MNIDRTVAYNTNRAVTVECKEKIKVQNSLAKGIRRIINKILMWRDNIENKNTWYIEEKQIFEVGRYQMFWNLCVRKQRVQINFKGVLKYNRQKMSQYGNITIHSMYVVW